jgi:hypothetical protein
VKEFFKKWVFFFVMSMSGSFFGSWLTHRKDADEMAHLRAAIKICEQASDRCRETIRDGVRTLQECSVALNRSVVAVENCQKSGGLK